MPFKPNDSTSASTGAGVDSFNGRTGAVSPAAGDYLSSTILDTSTGIGPFVDNTLDNILERVDLIEHTEVKVEIFQSITTATGTVTIPTGSSIVLDEYEEGTDCLVSKLDTTGRPNGEQAEDSTGSNIVSTLDTGGNYALTAEPAAYPVGIIYIISCPLDSYDNITSESILSSDRFINSGSVQLDSPYDGNLTEGLQALDEAKTEWIKPYLSGTYPKSTMIRLDDWTMISNKETSEYPAPQPVGDQYFPYPDENAVLTSDSSKQIVYGLRASRDEGYFVMGYKMYCEVGYQYDVILVRDPLGVKDPYFVSSFIPQESGYFTFALDPRPVLAGVPFDGLVVVTEVPGAQAKTVVNYNYQKSGDPQAPQNGTINQSQNDPSELWVNYLDNDGGLQTTLIQSMTVGSFITVGSFTWIVQSNTDMTSYAILGIVPAFVYNQTGVFAFDFIPNVETVIPYYKEDDYWAGNTEFKGLYVEDGSWYDAVQVDDAFRADIIIQDAQIPLDWDVVASSRDLGNLADQKTTDFLQQVEVTNTGDDAGVKFLNQVSVVGELIAGEDSYPVPIAFHCTEGNTTGTTITSAVDVTEILETDSGSATGLFNGTTAGNYLLVGSPQIYEGVKSKYDTLATVEPDNVIYEFYQDGATGWLDVPFMATNAVSPYLETGDVIAVNDSEQIFFGFDPVTRHFPDMWVETTFNINGVEYTYFWSRARIVTDITSDPVVQQLKLHTDRIEIELTNIFRYGRARNPIPLPFEMVANALKSPVDQNVQYSTELTAVVTNNKFASNKEDGIAIRIQRAYGLDTSIPVIIAISFYADGTGTGNVHFDYEVSQVNPLFVYDGTEPYTEYSKDHAIDTASPEVRNTIVLPVPINKVEIGAGIMVSIFRNGNGVEDTLSDDIVITNINVQGYGWKS